MNRLTWRTRIKLWWRNLAVIGYGPGGHPIVVPRRLAKKMPDNIKEAMVFALSEAIASGNTGPGANVVDFTVDQFGDVDVGEVKHYG